MTRSVRGEILSRHQLKELVRYRGISKAPDAATSRAFSRLRQSLLVSDELQVVIDDCESFSIIPALEIEGLVVRAVEMDHLAWT